MARIGGEADVLLAGMPPPPVTRRLYYTGFTMGRGRARRRSFSWCFWEENPRFPR